MRYITYGIVAIWPDGLEELASVETDEGAATRAAYNHSVRGEYPGCEFAIVRRVIPFDVPMRARKQSERKSGIAIVSDRFFNRELLEKTKARAYERSQVQWIDRRRTEHRRSPRGLRDLEGPAG